VEALVGLVPALAAFIAGVRFGREWSRIALRVAAAGALVLALLARYVGALPDHEWYTIAWIAIGAGALLMSAVALIGPSIFKRWLYALALSVGILTLIRLSISRDVMVWMLTGMTPP
jgi:hypothetical protein